MTLRTKIVSGVFWVALQSWTGRLVALGTTLLLLKFLSPRDFGILASALVVLSIIEAFSDAGLNKELVYRQTRIEDAYDTAFVFLLILNLSLCTLVVAASPIIARFADEAEVSGVVRWMALGLLFTGLGMVPRAILQKNLLFKQAALREIAAPILGGSIAVGMAITGFGVWSLVGRELAGTLTGMILLWLVCPYRPKFRFDWGLARSMIGYGKHMLAATLIRILMFNVDRVIIMKLMGLKALGFYTVAVTLVDIPFRLVSQAISNVLFPIFSIMQNDRSKLAGSYLKGVKTVGTFIIPAQFAVALFVAPLLNTFYGSQWSVTGKLMPILAIYGLFRGLTLLAGEVFKATGHPQYVSKFLFIHLLVLTVLLFFLGTWLDLIGISIAAAAAMGIRFGLDTYRVSRLVGVSVPRILSSFAKPLLSAVIAFCPAFLFLPGRTTILQFCALGLFVMVAYSAAFFLLDRKFFMEALQTMKLLLPSNRKSEKADKNDRPLVQETMKS